MLQRGRRDERVGQADAARSPEAPGALGDDCVDGHVGHRRQQASDPPLLGTLTGEQFGTGDRGHVDVVAADLQPPMAAEVIDDFRCALIRIHPVNDRPRTARTSSRGRRRGSR